MGVFYIKPHEVFYRPVLSHLVCIDLKFIVMVTIKYRKGFFAVISRYTFIATLIICVDI